MQTTLPAAASRDGLATVEQAADFLQVCRTTLYAMIRDGQLPATSIRNARRVPWAALHKIADDAMSDQTGEVSE